MPLSGGDADKVGNRYERLWAVRCVLEVLDEKADDVVIEPFTDHEEGFDLVLSRRGVAEHHQVKRQHTQNGQWSLSTLKRNGVLSNFCSKLRSCPASECYFISGHAASELRELTECARSASRHDDFVSMLEKSDKRRDAFSNLVESQGTTEHEAWSYLKRIHARSIDEDSLREQINTSLFNIVAMDDVENAYAHLSGLVDQSIHKRLRAIDIWRHLNENGVSPRDLANDTRSVTLVTAQNKRYVGQIYGLSIAGSTIPRREARQIFEKLESEDAKHVVLVTGEAGAGKSGVAAQLVSAAEENGWPTLAFRINSLPTMTSPKDVGRHMEMPESPVRVLGAISQGGPSLLIIDQLDAVSIASGRNPQYFDCVQEIIAQVMSNPSMRLVLVCRKFDVVNDHRIRRLTGEGGCADEVNVGRLDREIVKTVVEAMGLNAANLRDTQLELLTVPLHLYLLAIIVGAADQGQVDFKTPHDLFALYWYEKRRELDSRLEGGCKWFEVIEALCNKMSTTQRLSAPVSAVERYSRDADAMASAHVIVGDGGQYSFFHEAFFDYAFARVFSNSNKSISDFLLSGEQHLFRRGQIRQLLTFNRSSDPQAYAAGLSFVLTSANVRSHLKEVAFALLMQQAEPSEVEWRIVEPLLDDSNDYLRMGAVQLLAQSPWFLLAASEGKIDSWLAADDSRAEQGVSLLSAVCRTIPDTVAEILENRDYSEDVWKTRAAYVLASGDFGNSRRLFDLFLMLQKNGALDQIQSPTATDGQLWMTLYGLKETHPDWYCEALGNYLEHHMTLSAAIGADNPFATDFAMAKIFCNSDDDRLESPGPSGTIPQTQHDYDFVEVARNAPVAFARNVFDFVLNVAELTARRESAAPYPDSVWPLRYHNEAYGTADKILLGLEVALGEIARTSPAELERYIEKLLASETEVAQYLLVRAFTANGEHFADRAAAYLCANSRRFETGWTSERHWASRLLLEAITPYCAVTWLMDLESYILAYYTDYELSCRSYGDGSGTPRGYAQLILLNGIAESRMSLAAQRRLNEWRRKFRVTDHEPSPGIVGGFVGSPITVENAQCMDDEQWLSAINKYNSSRPPAGRSWLTGGADQLSTVLTQVTKAEPVRFAGLLHRIPLHSNVAYFNAILWGLRDAGADSAISLDACKYCHSLPGHPCGRDICFLLDSLADKELAPTVLDMITWYAMEGDGPLLGEYAQPQESGPVDLEFAGINSVRGRAAISIATALYKNPALYSYFNRIIHQIVKDPSPSVRACVVEILTALLNSERAEAIKLFIDLVEEGTDSLLGTQRSVRFLGYALQTHLADLTSVVMRMLASPSDHIAEAGSSLACMTALGDPEAIPLAKTAMSGSRAQRRGAARVFAANLSNAECRAFCEASLEKLFYDEDSEVLRVSAGSFRTLKGSELEQFTDLGLKFTKSPAFRLVAYDLFHALEKTTARLPEFTCEICEQFIDQVVQGNPEVNPNGRLGSIISTLIVRVYQQTGDTKIQTRCLDMVDVLVKHSAYGLENALAILER